VFVAVSPSPSPAPPPAAPAVTDHASAPAPAPPAAPFVTPAPAPAPAPAAAPKPAKKPPAAAPAPAPPATPTRPAIKHVFLIVLSDQGFNQAFGPEATAPYLARTLTAKGELLPNYYAVAPGNLANAVALVSGQGPTVATTQNCPAYADISPATVSDDGQVLGDGCIYPATTQTLADQLIAAGHTWKAYVQGMGTTADGRPATCRTPPAPADPAATPVDPAAPPADPAAAPDLYTPWRNPFVYFHSILDTPLCAQNDVGIEQLATDLQTEATTPTLSYIVPDACHNGSDSPCAPGQPAGLAPADAFLQLVVPQIMSSDAYRDGGLIAITFDQAPQTGEHADASACCDTPAYPNLPAAAPTDPALPTTPTGGGGRVGLLLLSPFVKPGTTSAFGSYNHFSLLRSIEDLFGLDPLGYAALPTLPAFDASVYTNPAGDAR
jgi:hypothetical protein